MNTPKIRFKGFADDWEQRKLSEICERITRKNRNNESDLPLTIASQFGLIDQRDFFNKIVAAKDMSNYYLLKKGEFAYNKSYSNGFDYGSIKRLNAYKQGCLSTLYICFGITSDEVESDYLECFFDTLKWYGDVSMICAEGARNHGLLNVDTKGFFDEVTVDLPKSLEEQKRISAYLNALNHLITLHQRKCDETKQLKKFMLQKMFPKNGEKNPEIRFEGFTDDWEQRKFGNLADYKKGPFGSAVTKDMFVPKSDDSVKVYEQQNAINKDWSLERYFLPNEYALTKLKSFEVHGGDIIVSCAGTIGEIYEIPEDAEVGIINQALMRVRVNESIVDKKMFIIAFSNMIDVFSRTHSNGSAIKNIPPFADLKPMGVMMPSMDEQQKVSGYFEKIDNLITLHQRKCCELKKLKQYMANHMFVNQSTKCDRNIATNHKKLQERTKEMGELESVIEQRLIDQLCGGDSQWTYRKDIRTEEQLWDNFKYILEQNNKAKLNDMPLSDSEFAKIKNDVSHASFYDAGKWQVGENGKVYVHVQRGNETLHLVVMNNEHIAGGTSVYEVINQYQAFKTDEVDDKRDRRFDVTLLINGIPMIHIELKNKDHSYMDGYRQIEKYISEGKFRGLFSNIQMFVVSNAVDTKYFAAARAAELAEGKKFITGWVDNENYPVCDYLDFAKAVLRIPQAHEMIAKYTVLDNEKKKLLILRPYQIHAIEAMRAASKRSISGYIWHTTGSGKTMTSYKATRNLLMDIPSIEKTIFLIDRKDLDMQTKMAFQSYADNDTIDVDDTENVDALIRRLTDGNRQMIVTTRQKLQTMIAKRLQEGTKEYDKIRNLRVAFVVDECHRAVTPETKRKIERFFAHSLWYGFTGTPIFEENRYEQKGDLPQTTDELYGACLHSYTIKNAIHDEAVLGFMVENLGPKKEDVDDAVFETEEHMRQVLDVVLNQSYTKLGMQNGKGRTYEGILTVGSIAKAQRYYELLKRIKAGKDALKINEEICKVVPDFPKFAITYSVTENDEASTVNQDKMRESLQDYNAMFGTHYDIENINAYNSNLNDRLARKEKRYMERSQQLDLVIVVNRLLTGFDAPCLSTLYMDRSPMSPQDIIQAFSRTNRLFDANKTYGQVVTFQSPKEFKKEIDRALELYSRGGESVAISEDWESVREAFSIAVKTIHALGRTQEEINQLSPEQQKSFIYVFRGLDKNFAHLKAFSRYREELLADYDFSQEEYENYAAIYKNILEKLKKPKDENETDAPVMDDYDLIAYSKMRVDFEYIVELLQGLVNYLDQSSNDFQDAIFAKNILALREISKEFAEDNQKLGELLEQVIDNIEQDKDRYKGQDIAVVVNQMRYDAIDTEIKTFAKLWNLNEDDVRYEVYNYRDGEMANENTFKDRAYASYKEGVEEPMPKFKFRKIIVEKFKHDLMENVLPLRD